MAQWGERRIAAPTGDESPGSSRSTRSLFALTSEICPFKTKFIKKEGRMDAARTAHMVRKSEQGAWLMQITALTEGFLDGSFGEVNEVECELALVRRQKCLQLMNKLCLLFKFQILAYNFAHY